MHHRVIIIGGIQDILDDLKGAQPETGQWESLKTACEAADDAIQGASMTQQNRLHSKLHEVEMFVTAGAPYDMELVDTYTAELNSML